MQYKAIWKDTFRELSNSIMRFLAILIIIFLGVGFYVGISATSPNMLWTADEYYSNHNLMDYRVLSTYGLTDEDLEDLNALSGYTVQSHYANDFVVEDYSESIRLYSYDLENGQSINDYYIVDGRLPETSGEIALDSQESFLSDVQIGDRISLESGEDNGNPENNLHQQTFEVVGFVRSPLFIELGSRGNTTIGSGSLNGFGVISEEDYNAEIRTEAYITVENTENFEAYTDEYEAMINENADELNHLLADLETRRAEEIENEIQQEIDDGRAEIEEAEQELADAETELEEARVELDEGWQEYENGVAELEEQTANARQEINANEAQLQEELDNLNTQEQNLIQQRDELQTELNNLAGADEEIAAGREQLTDGLAQIEAGLAEIEANREAILQGIEEIDQAIVELEAALENPLLPPDTIEEIQAQITALEKEREEVSTPLQEEEQLIAQRTELQTELDNLNAQEQELIAGRNALNDGIQQINNGLAQIEDGRQQINAGFNELEEARATLETETANAQTELADAEAELNEAEADYQEGLETFEDERQTAQEEIADGRAELEDAEQELADLPAPEYLLFDRSDNPGYLEYKDNADRLSIIAMVFPGFFFLIAIFISFTTMTRMVDEEREYIGIMKSLGYANHQILTKFITYAVLATSVGAILGLIAGYTLIPELIFFAYSSMYNFPEMLLQGYTLYTTIALIAAFVSTVGASLLAVQHSLKSNAASLLQPKAPKRGSRIWLERIPFIWRRLSFNYKITFRNVFRYKSRMLMTIFGIAGSTGLILTGFGISDSIGDIPQIQYGEINQFQAYVALDPNLEPEALESHKETIQNDARIGDALLVTQDNATANGAELNEQNISIFVPNDTDRLDDFVKLMDYKDGAVQALDDSGAYITQKLAQLFEVEVGDQLEITSENNEEWVVDVSGIVENYIGHTLYMTPEYYEKMTGSENGEPNLQLIKYDTNEVDETEIGRDLMNTDEVIGVNYVTDVAQSFSGTLDSLDLITQILVISAAALAFIVLYNLTNINVSERQRELSTIKVLGSYDHEVTMYIYRENIILTILGIFVGFGFGTVLTNFIMDTMEIDMLVFGREIHLRSYVYSGLLTVLFSVVIMIVIHYQLKRINMVEALKAND
ncbi:FtsX-like permease family protein [Carnobacteriaceae bacterium 52-44]